MLNKRTLFFYAVVVNLVFIIYGSLIPFEIRHKTLAEAWQFFREVPYLRLGAGSRADWIANIVLYIPFAFFADACLAYGSGILGRRLSRIALVLAAGASLAVAVEFAQIWFAPRTVSLNDIIAEIIGTILGVVLWESVGHRLTKLAREIMRGGPAAAQSAAVFYVLAYIALSLFPYDFTASANELAAKLAAGRAHWFLAACGGRFICAAKLAAEVLAVIPVGVLLGMLFRQDRRWTLRTALYAGLGLGVFIEVCQFFLASGVSQGVSVLTRGAGAVLGVILYRHFSWHYVDRAVPYLRPLILVAAVPYGVVLLVLNRWFSGHWTGWGEAGARLADLHFLPFYYHYYTAEAVAVVSLIYQFGIYLPIGAAVWLWRWAGGAGLGRTTLLVPVAAAAITAGVIEAGKLFIAGEHPDPTNVLIAAAAALSAYGLLRFFFTLASSSRPAATVSGGGAPASGDQGAAPGEEASRAPLTRLQIAAVAALIAAVAAAATDPFQPLLLVIALVAYAAVLRSRPGAWLVWVPAVLPLLDFAPHSGRMFWSEFDTLLLATLGVCYLRVSPGPLANFRRTGRRLLAAFAVSAALGVVIGLWPPAPLDGNAFTSYMSPYNALRAAKGLFFALAFLPLLARQWEDPPRAARRLALGMSLGVTAEIVYVLWERVTFSGLLNFATDYRITGSFPGMHIGGAYIECYLSMALPFVLLWAWQQRRLAATLLAAGIYGLGAYSVMVTFSRGGEAAFALATLIAASGFARLMLRDHGRRLLGIGAVALFAGAAFVVAWPIVSGKFNESRLATIGRDVVTRVDHWQDALSILHRDGDSTLGEGLGSFPNAYFWRSHAATRPATYAFRAEDGNVFLRLGSGETLYFEQLVKVEPDRDYTLALDLRSQSKPAALTVPICEKALLYSFTCDWKTVPLTTAPGQWGHYAIRIQTKKFGPPGSLFPRPVKLSMFNGRTGTVVDVDNVALTDASGRSLVVNGDFSRGMDHWFFSTDSHLAWHAKNLFIHVLFEQGWVGLIIFAMLVAYAVACAFKRGWHNDALGVALFASLAAFLVVGIVDSLIDETRIGFLFFLLLGVGLLVTPPRRGGPGAAPSASRPPVS